MGQNFGAGRLDRCKKTLVLCLAEGAVFLAAAIALILGFGKPLLSLFNRDPEVIDTGYIRLMMVMLAFFGLILLSIGIMGIYLMNILNEAKKMPHYVVRREDTD